MKVIAQQKMRRSSPPLAGTLSAVVRLALPLLSLLATEPSGDAVVEPRRHRYSASLEVGFSQFRDELNSNLVYHGAQLGSRFGYTHDWHRLRLQWRVRVLFGLYASHGMPAIVPQLDWLDISTLFPIRRPGWTLWLGPGLDSDLRWYVNPFLHSGHFFWYGHYDVELRGGADFSIRGQPFRASLRINALSLSSRPSPSPDPYFYDWRFTDLVGRTHRELRLGSLDSIRHLEAGLEWLVPRRKHDLGLGYTLRLEDYAPAPSLRTVDHIVRITWHQR